MRPPRVAYFPDSFHEVNGVAHTSRNFVGYAERHRLPFLCVRAGTRATAFEQTGELRTLELARSAASVGMEKDLAFDPLFWRHADRIEAELRRFKPDVIHLTGPSELGMFAAYFAHTMKIPLAASWHTNVHQYAAKRLTWLRRMMPGTMGAETGELVEDSALGVAMRFYGLAKVLYAPNRELCDLLERRTGTPCRLMQRGVDTELFVPRAATHNTNAEFVLGFVGRLSIEKNVGLLPQVQRELTAAGVAVKFLIVGHGAEEQELRRTLPGAEFAGVLRGNALAHAYTKMDLLVFPSHTDTFGNVVLEALASGVPAVVTTHGGPRYIVRDGETGAIAEDQDFATAIAAILRDPAKLETMRQAARTQALGYSWDAVFDRVYEGYAEAIDCAGVAAREERAHLRGQVDEARRHTPPTVAV